MERMELAEEEDPLFWVCGPFNPLSGEKGWKRGRGGVEEGWVGGRLI